MSRTQALPVTREGFLIFFLIFPGSAFPSRERCSHDQGPHHQRATLCERRQTSRQSRRLPAACGCPRAFQTTDRRRCAVHLRHRRTRHAGRTRRHPIRAGYPRLLRSAARNPGRHLSAVRPFLPDRYVVGTCPHCGYGSARGDQCDGCGALLDAVELIDPQSALSGDRSLQVRTSRHLFLRQSLLVEKLNAWIDSRSGWPAFVTSTAKSWLTSKLRDRCITRDLAWGIPVPRDGFEGKVFYVW